MTGAWPQDQIDHCNTMPSDNRWKNLREGSAIINAQNRRRPYANSKSGFLGVNHRKDRPKFCARIMVKGKAIHIGYYDSVEKAHSAYVEAKRRLHEGSTL